jgi:calcyphosin
MSSFKETFEKTLKEKLEQKATLYASEETVLIKYFKYFDLDNSNSVSKTEWVRAVEKIGVVVEDNVELERLFDVYDTDHSGSLDYKEFSASLFGEDSRITKQLLAKTSLNSSYQRADEIVGDLKEKFLKRSLGSLIGLSRLYFTYDQNLTGFVSSEQFVQALKEYRIGINDPDLEFLFKFLDSDNKNKIKYSDFIHRVTGDMTFARQSIVQKAYKKLCEENETVTVSVIEQKFNTIGHPEIKTGKKTKDEVISDFISTFELHHSMYGKYDSIVSLNEFIGYYNYVSFKIPNDSYFEGLVSSSWKLYEIPLVERPTNAERIVNIGASTDDYMDRIRKKLANRGPRGILGLAKQFQIMDDDGSKTLSLYEFTKACKDFRLDIPETDIKKIFQAIDRDRSGYLDYDELLRALRGPINSFRRNLVDQAWKKVDKNGDGVLDIEDIRGVYSASKHPDVLSGRKTEDNILNEFLETFELNHNLGTGVDHKVTKEEFFEYYTNVSSSIEDDTYFELMITNAWKLKDDSVKNARWAGAYSSNNFSLNHKTQWLADHHRGQFGGTVISSAPFGTTDEPIDWSTSLRPQ